MNQSERRRYLIQELIKENTQYNNLEIPQNKEEQKQLLRSLMNIRFACPISDEFKQIQDEYLTEENKNLVVTLDEKADTEFIEAVKKQVI